MRVTVITPEAMRERNQRFRESEMSREDFERSEIERTGTTIFVWWDDDGAFTYCCPSCFRLGWGRIGEKPVSGWDRPQWKNSGSRDRPTLTPSLGCWCWREGEGTGHWWLRDGELVHA